MRLGEMPPRQHLAEITVPAETRHEIATEATVPGRHERGGAHARAFGSAGIEEVRSVILLGPLAVARVERTTLIEPAHPDAAAIRSGRETPTRCNGRLFEP